MRTEQMAPDRFTRGFVGDVDRDSEIDDLTQFQSEFLGPDSTDEPAPWRAPARATETLVFERRRAVRTPQKSNYVIDIIERDRTPRYLLNGFVTGLVVAGMIALGSIGVRRVAAIYPDEGLPRVAAPTFPLPAPAPSVPPPAASAPEPARLKADPAPTPKEEGPSPARVQASR